MDPATASSAIYVEWRHGITATMRQTHVAGEKLFADFTGDTMPVFDGITREVRAAKIFVAVLLPRGLRHRGLGTREPTKFVELD